MFQLDTNTSTLHHAAPPPTTSAATVHVDMGKVVGVLRTTHTVAVNQTDHEDEDDSTYEENTIGNALSSLYAWARGTYNFVTFL